MLDYRDNSLRKCYGTGLMALDIVSTHSMASPPKQWLGGSCGNVLTILSFLGWSTSPIARLGDDSASKIIVDDMLSYGVSPDYTIIDNTIKTPIIYQQNYITKDGHPAHKFKWKCPNCGSWLPRYRPIRLSDVHSILQKPFGISCFFFDRISPASLRLARKAKEEGAIVVFEPPRIKNEPKFIQALDVCDILKYSNERCKQHPIVAFESITPLVIETLGPDGLRFRLRDGNSLSEWKHVAPYQVDDFADASGAGDWCTAGMLDFLTRDRDRCVNFDEEIVIASLKYGQALSSINCEYYGARGAMYKNSADSIKERVTYIVANKKYVQSTNGNDIVSEDSQLYTCPDCE